MTGKLPAKRKFEDLVKPVDRAVLMRRAVNGMAVLGGAFAIISVLSWLWPDSDRGDLTPGNNSVPAATLVTGFAREFVISYLSAKGGDEPKLAHYITVKEVKLPSVAAAFTDTDIAFAKQITTTEDGVALWTVTVSGIVNGGTTATPQRTYYRVPITVINGAPRAVALPTQVAGPGVGVDFRLGYGYSVEASSQLGSAASGFVRSYLTGQEDFTRYITTDSTEKPIQPAPYTKVDVLTIAANVGSNGNGETAAEVYVTVAARSKNYTLTQLAYPLTLRSVEGQWQVVSISAVPAVQLRPENPQRGGSTTTSTTAPAPPSPTRG